MPLELIDADELAILRVHKAEHEEWAKSIADKISTAEAFIRVASEERDSMRARVTELEEDRQRRIDHEMVLHKVCAEAEDERDRYREDAQNFHRVMGYLRAMRKEHGLCQPRARKACTACNAKDNLDAVVDAYKGAPIRIA